MTKPRLPLLRGMPTIRLSQRQRLKLRRDATKAYIESLEIKKSNRKGAEMLRGFVIAALFIVSAGNEPIYKSTYQSVIGLRRLVVLTLRASEQKKKTKHAAKRRTR
jgi:hypothetical protein